MNVTLVTPGEDVAVEGDPLVSPLGRSRYGRNRKPKVSQDFCSIDDVFNDKKPKSPKKTPSPNKKKPNLKSLDKTPNNSTTKVSHVRVEQLVNDKLEEVIERPESSPKERKFFKTSSSRTSLHQEKNVQTFKENNKTQETTQQLQEDVTKVLKIVTNKCETPEKSKLTSKPSLKTYSNKRKHSRKPEILESFALPDEPIIPDTKPRKLDKKLDTDVSPPDKINIAEPNRLWNIDLNGLDDKNGCTFDEDCSIAIFDEVRVKADEAVVKRAHKEAKVDDKEEKSGSAKVKDCVVVEGRSLDKVEEIKRNELDAKTEVNNDLEIIKKSADLNTSDKVTNCIAYRKKDKVSFGCNKNVKSTKVVKEAKKSLKKTHRKSDNSVKGSLSQESLEDLDEFCVIENKKHELIDLTTNETDFKLIENENAKQQFETKKGKSEEIEKKSGSSSINELTDEKLLHASEIKRESGNFVVGDLMWARVGNHPYWPCLITLEPELNVYQKNGNWNRVFYHVRFFGDKGRRSWIDETHIMPFVDENDIEVLLKKAKEAKKPASEIQAFTIKPNKQAKWKIAVNEALSLKDKSPQVRDDFFFEMFAGKREKKRKIMGVAERFKMKKIKTEPTNSTPPMRRNERRSCTYTPKVSPIKPKPPQESNDKKDKKEDVVAEPQVSSECSSDAETAAKKPVDYVEQEALYKRNNLFKGVSKEKVCQVCEKPGEVFKCKGACNGYYHSDCAYRTVKAKTPPQISLVDQIDLKMSEIMNNIDYSKIYADTSTDDAGSEDESKTIKVVKHVTADGEFFDTSETYASKNKKNGKEVSTNKELICAKCLDNLNPDCFVCLHTVSQQERCSIAWCGRYCHPTCLKHWPQTQHPDTNTFICPSHVCHTCVSDDPRSYSVSSRCDKLAKCLRCPATYHMSSHCIPAGSKILTATQLVCPRHIGKQVKVLNTTWCFVCAEGGDLICCETCPTSVHADCLHVQLRDDGSFVCEDCESGRLPLYNDVVWVKLGWYRWWPARVLFPNEVPLKVAGLPHNDGEFVVRFFGTYDHYWVNRGRVFLFEDGDKGDRNGGGKRKVDELFNRAVLEAIDAYKLKKVFKNSRETDNPLKPPPYIKIKSNKPIGNVRMFDGNVSSMTACNCSPEKPHPCGPDSDCLNRLLLTECNPDVCPAKEKCENQRFTKRSYPSLAPFKTDGRGWGLKTFEKLEKGRFVIEYVGEVIDEVEYKKRLERMHSQKDENYYFLMIEKDRMIDAGPKGNLARFMNHSCQPNCETQKWTVNGNTRIGLFASEEIAENSELTFNYNLICIGEDRKICRCGAPNCSGYIGSKVKVDEPQKAVKTVKTVKAVKAAKKRKSKKKKVELRDNNEHIDSVHISCFRCGKRGKVRKCRNITCPKYYHKTCANLTSWPKGKWSCPWHLCNICTKRTVKCCIKCTSSYCKNHYQDNIWYDQFQKGYLCREHCSELVRIASTIPDTPTIKIEPIDPDLQTDSTQETSISTSTLATSTPIKPESSGAKRKRGRPRKGGRRRKKPKTDEEETGAVKVADGTVLVQQEVKLTSSVPTRHLRQRARGRVDESCTDLERFLKRQLEFEKDLPIRKRSRPRCESSL